ncbi:hypothetical protein A2Z63_03110 [Candidatus Giovannonibacteria bacterium RIFCSPLOWO2_02_44_8]|uniref:Uncharacterized protein n=3 Tax=Candidatus Giovannoniibacteriota TaxID=1752738 RepID=A0A1F5XF10_9BACT|nr:MAG: hypothetical protein A2W57_01795 [Candidatus Giovannonibacteria bacterium RIFCSPHIGHO2_02_43_16]OGF86416.1 MAG: hypothetical protein A2Z63_03110 [Candidatus Giovannonibacteria bacterium RIFCSPLOWO2_02_44_8]
MISPVIHLTYWGGRYDGGMSNEMPTNDEEFLRQEQTAESQEWREKQDSYADLGTYIKMNKQTVLSQEDPEVFGPHNLKNDLRAQRGEYFGVRFNVLNLKEVVGFPAKVEISYIDKDGNVAKVDVDLSKILTYKDVAIFGSMSSNSDKNQEMLDQRGIPDRVDEDLAKLGFSHMNSMDIEIRKKIDAATSEKRERLGREAREQKKKEFDF